MLTKSQMLASVIGVCLLTIVTTKSEIQNKTSQIPTQIQSVQTTDVNSRLLPTPVTLTTTSLPVPLQPPQITNLTTTTSSFSLEQEGQQQNQPKIKTKGVANILTEHVAVSGSVDDAVVVESDGQDVEVTTEVVVTLSDSTKELNEHQATSVEAVGDTHHNEEDESGDSVESFLPTLPSRERQTQTPTATTKNGHGYIQFDINEEMPIEAVKRQLPKRKSKADTVNEVLYNLFPNGFSDIFRFSYPTDTSTTTTTTETPTSNEPTTKVTTPAITTERAPTQLSTQPPKNQTIYSFQATVTKQYRRELSPGHTEIVVEKIQRPRRIFNSAEEFRDGTNHISKDELLRINRAAVDAPVLPSLLLRPETSRENDTSADLNSNGPIVILNDSDAELDESMSIEDNQIAESQHIGQQLFQRSLPTAPQGVESYNSQLGPAEDQKINVHIVHDQTLSNAHQHLPTGSSDYDGPIAPKAPDVGPQALDVFQVNTEQHFQQRHNTQEAPSRQFLKSFKPVIAAAAEGPIPKGAFHYETNVPQARINSRPPTQQDYAGPYVRPAAQLVYHREEQSRQVGIPQSAANQEEVQKLHTSVAASTQSQTQPQPQPQAVAHYADYGAAPTPNSVVFVTLNTPQPQPQPHTQQVQQNPAPAAISGPSPHDYVAEAAAESTHNHIQHAPAPKPSGYTFVEVQKSVNIHNKLITEKDGRLVEQHETIYHTPQQATSQYSPKDYVVSNAAQYQPPTQQKSQKDYVSLSTHPINVQQLEYESEPLESSISHASIQLEGPQQQYATQQYEHSAPQPPLVVEKVVPQPYAVPVEKIVDRPVHVVHEVEKQVPQPYPVREVVEKLVDRPVPVEKVVEHQVNVPYPVEHYIDRPYPVQEIIEKHIAIPYAVPEPVAVPIHYEHYIDRPYPVETIVEKPVPYPVETVVEKIVEKNVPVQVERIVEKPIEKTVEKIVDRPVPIPIHVPIAIRLPFLPPTGPPPGPFGWEHPNALTPWSHTGPTIARIPPKVLRNYYARMIKKLVPQMTTFKTTTATPAQAPTPTTTKAPPPSAPKTPTSQFNINDMRFDLKPPPPPAGSQWLRGARYIYNTLPVDLATAAASTPTQLIKSYIGPVPAANNNEVDEFQRWRNGHTLKRSPDFGRNLHLEYGFKPPLVPSVEIDDKGQPLKPDEQ